VKRALEQVAQLVYAESGIVLKESQYPALRGAVGRAVGNPDPGTFLSSASDPIAGSNAVARLIEEVTVGETFFLRDRRQLQAIDWQRALESAEGGTIRIWSAACSTGEEPYSLALLAAETFFPVPPPVRILATDISSAALAVAQRGRYRPRAIREVEPDLRRRYFHEDGGTHLVAESLRRGVSFVRHNLVRDPVPPLGEAAFDLIVCRNVLIYFDAETTLRVLDRLERALRPGGTLVLGVADALCRTGPQLGRFADPPVAASRPSLGSKLRRRQPTSAPSTEPEPEPVPSVAERLAAALSAADAGRPAEGLAEATAAATADPLNADAYFVRGLLELNSGRTEEAIASLRRALYVDPTFGLAAFKLARAYEASGDGVAARRSYEQALRTLDPGDERHDLILRQVDLADVAAACRTRLGALR
jgi:chemotaxis protein methyltransferase CheR